MKTLLLTLLLIYKIISLVICVQLNYNLDYKSNIVYMIELNPFTPFTSGCLFNWKKDLHILRVEISVGSSFKY